MKNSTSIKKLLLDKFDKEYYGENVNEESQILNKVGKVNVGWNLEYLKSLPAYDLLIDVGAADDYQSLHDARPDATSILIDANHNYSTLYNSFFENRKGYYKICAVGDKQDSVQYTEYLEAPYLSSVEERVDYDSNKKLTYMVEMNRLDDIVDLSLTKIGALLKLDIEGSELKALSGAEQVLIKCNIVICEISLDKNFPGGDNFYKINELLTMAGFCVKDVIRVPRLKFNNYPAQVIDLVYGR